LSVSFLKYPVKRMEMPEARTTGAAPSSRPILERETTSEKRVRQM
jgi:hypothetical protein